ncbi:MAG: DUF3307 domain-containing protein [Gammaproteobacteria bacterium]|nr:DUF3307 domain-containing protein [Gammaproteobacteria bacterium]
MVEPNLLLLLLLIGHLMADFYWQPKSWVEQRNRLHLKAPALYFHSLIHGGVLLLLSSMAELSFVGTLIATGLMILSHFLIDLAKSYLGKQLKWLVLDQILHLLVIILLWCYLTEISVSDLIGNLSQQLDQQVLMIVLAYALLGKPTSVFITMVLSRWTPDDSDNDRSLAAAGETIGMIERVLMLTFILSNQVAGVGFVLAAKSIFRFGDLRDSHDRKLTEYVMLGTLTSVTVTMMIGLLAQYVNS